MTAPQAELRARFAERLRTFTHDAEDANDVAQELLDMIPVHEAPDVEPDEHRLQLTVADLARRIVGANAPADAKIFLYYDGQVLKVQAEWNPYLHPDDPDGVRAWNTGFHVLFTAALAVTAAGFPT